MADEEKVKGEDVELDDDVIEDVSGGLDEASSNNNINNPSLDPS